jgi:hypothetical protein
MSSTAAAAPGATFGEALHEAKQLYFDGETDEALLAFQQLQLRALQEPDQQPWAEIVEAMTYLGELHVKLGDDEAAQRVFRYVLERDLDTPISPYRHPIEVVFLFDQVRDQVAAERAMETPEEVRVPPPRWHAHLPLGIPQLAQGRPVAGVLYGVGQGALLATSFGVFSELRRVNVARDAHPRGWNEEQIASGVAWRRWAVQWPATLGFYGVWTVSVFDARAHWRASHAPATLSVAPGAAGVPGVTFAGSF